MTGNRKKWVFWLEELGQLDHDVVGKKAANLGEMTKMGVRVPPGFALSVEMYTDFLNMTGAIYEIRQILRGFVGTSFKGFNEISANIRQIVESKAMPQEMGETIASHYEALCQRCCNTAEVAVSTRSAGPASHPGQYETYLNVRGRSDLIDKIKRVWASTFNTRSLVFRGQKEMPLECDPIGVVVLKMVNARAAGVIFTADPNTGDTTKMISEANWGLGESVVSGMSTPDTYILDKENLEIREKKLGEKSKYVTFEEIGVAEKEISPDMRATFCLSEGELREIGKLGKMLEEHFGVPQDAEWAIDKDLPFPENVILLQTRPEIIAQRKKPVDQIIDYMVRRFST